MLFRFAYLSVTSVFALVRLLLVSDRDKELEILALPAGPDASAGPSRDAPAAGSGPARPAGAGAAQRPGTPGRARAEPQPGRARLPLRDHDLVTQHQYLHVLSQSLTGSSRSSANKFVTLR